MKFEEFFKYCDWENPVFRNGMFWLFVFIVCGIGTLHFKRQDAREAAEAAANQQKPKEVVKDAQPKNTSKDAKKKKKQESKPE